LGQQRRSLGLRGRLGDSGALSELTSQEVSVKARGC